MKAIIKIEYEGNFNEQDLQEEVSFIEETLDDLEEPNFDKFKVSYNILKEK